MENIQDYIAMLEYVRDLLAVPRNRNERKKLISYSRYEHTRRVLGWVDRIYEHYEGKDMVDHESLVIAAIFHDSGYNTCEDIKQHAAESSAIAAKYLESISYDRVKAAFICDIIARHSKKKFLFDDDLCPELIILMEADLFDDTGAFGIILGCRIESVVEGCTFESIGRTLDEYVRAEQKDNPMRTPYSRMMWDKNTELVESFCTSYSRDLECTVGGVSI